MRLPCQLAGMTRAWRPLRSLPPPSRHSLRREEQLDDVVRRARTPPRFAGPVGIVVVEYHLVVSGAVAQRGVQDAEPPRDAAQALAGKRRLAHLFPRLVQPSAVPVPAYL